MADALRDGRVEARIEEFGEGTPTAADAANAVGAPIDQIVKSLVFACDGRRSSSWCRATAGPTDEGGSCRGLRARQAGERRRRRALTGFPPGGVAPFPLPGIDTVLMEQELLGHESVWIGAGSSRHMAALAPADLAGRPRTACQLSVE